MESTMELFGRRRTLNDGREKFSNLRLKEEYTNDDHNRRDQNSKIIELFTADGLLFALAQSGISTAFNLESKERICSLNLSPNEVIRSLFYNKLDDSLITVSVHASDYYSALKCRTTKIEFIRSGKPEAGMALFESEILKYPSFVEFDDLNSKIITYSAENCIYKVFDMRSYTMLFSIPSDNIEDIKISQGVILLIFTKTSSHIPLQIRSIEDGTNVKSFNHLLHFNKKVDFIELLNQKLFVKQENENLQILDVNTYELVEDSGGKFLTPSSVVFLYAKNALLTFRHRTPSVWNCQGELVTSFENHLLSSPYNIVIYITDDQNFILSYCKEDSDDSLSAENGYINISSIATGESIAKLKSSSRNEKSVSDSEALKGITALHYDEQSNEVYTGNNTGRVHVWSKSSITSRI